MEEPAQNKGDFKENLVRLIIGVIVFGTVSTSVYYAVKLNKENNFKRVTTESGEYDLENSISYDILKTYSVVEVESIIGENKLFIAKTQSGYDGIHGATDLFTDKDILEGTYTSVINSQPIEDYFVAYDMIQAKYFEEDVESLLKNIQEDYETVKEKILVKE